MKPEETLIFFTLFDPAGRKSIVAFFDAISYCAGVTEFTVEAATGFEPV
jgi:hypothetical protein